MNVKFVLLSQFFIYLLLINLAVFLLLWCTRLFIIRQFHKFCVLCTNAWMLLVRRLSLSADQCICPTEILFLPSALLCSNFHFFFHLSIELFVKIVYIIVFIVSCLRFLFSGWLWRKIKKNHSVAQLYHPRTFIKISHATILTRPHSYTLEYLIYYIIIINYYHNIIIIHR